MNAWHCEVRFEDKAKLRRHISDVHGPKVTCPLDCDPRFKAPDSRMYLMRKHLINYHHLSEETTKTTLSDFVSNIQAKSKKLTKEFPEGDKRKVDEIEPVEKVERKKAKKEKKKGRKDKKEKEDHEKKEEQRVRIEHSHQ